MANSYNFLHFSQRGMRLRLDQPFWPCRLPVGPWSMTVTLSSPRSADSWCENTCPARWQINSRPIGELFDIQKSDCNQLIAPATVRVDGPWPWPSHHVTSILLSPPPTWWRHARPDTPWVVREGSVPVVSAWMFVPAIKWSWGQIYTWPIPLRGRQVEKATHTDVHIPAPKLLCEWVCCGLYTPVDRHIHVRTGGNGGEPWPLPLTLECISVKVIHGLCCLIWGTPVCK